MLLEKGNTFSLEPRAPLAVHLGHDRLCEGARALGGAGAAGGDPAAAHAHPDERAPRAQHDESLVRLDQSLALRLLPAQRGPEVDQGLFPREFHRRQTGAVR